MKRWNLIAFWGFLPLATLFLGLGALRLQAAPAVEIVVVNILADESDGSCIDGDCSLRDAIDTATSNDTIVFDNGLAGGIIDVSANGTLIVDKRLTISGTVPITISGNNLVRIFEVITFTRVSFFSLTIANGNSTALDCPSKSSPFACGAGIRIHDDSEVIVKDVLFFSNTAQLGAAIYLGESELNVYSSTFLSNSGDSGGGIFVRGRGRTTVQDSKFIGNSVKNGGGAINNGNGDPLLVQNSLFADNSAGSGGALYGAGATDITVQNSTLHDNSAEQYGGAIMTTSDLTIQNSSLSGNVAGRQGGAIFSQGSGQLLVENSTISGNSAVGGESDGGGAVRMLYAPATNIFRNTTVVSNTAPNADGRDGLWIGAVGTLQIRNSIIAHNGTANCTAGEGTFDGDSSSIADDNSCTGFMVGDPLIAPLADNGGSTLTHALMAGSPAIDSGNNAICLTMDQRGIPRPLDGDDNGFAICDMGAYEYIYISYTNFLSALFKS